jgi:hypothetical protein
MAAWNTRETNERKALSQVQSDTSELHEYIRYLERDVDYIKSKLTTETSPDPCTEVSGDERMECLRLNTVMRIDKIRGAIKEEIYRILQQQQRQRQGQSNYGDTVVYGHRAQMDVRARAGNRSGGYSGSGNTELGATVYRGVPSVRADVLPEMRADRSDEVPRIQREER